VGEHTGGPAAAPGLAWTDLEDLRAGGKVGQAKLDLAIQAARPHERGVQRVRPVRGHQHLRRQR